LPPGAPRPGQVVLPARVGAKEPLPSGSVLPQAFDLDEFLCSDNGELSNLQTKLLLGRPIEGLSESQAVDIAFGNLLEKITCFGIQEHFDESLALIARTLGVKPLAYGSRNQRDPTLALRFDRSHLEKIIELNAIDLELYERARQTFTKRTGLLRGQSKEYLK
jgi:hypothetical protein